VKWRRFWKWIRPKDSKVKETEEIDPFPSKLIQEWEALWEITVKRYKDPRKGNPEWN
jgi:hypothetical protein